MDFHTNSFCGKCYADDIYFIIILMFVAVLSVLVWHKQFCGYGLFACLRQIVQTICIFRLFQSKTFSFLHRF